MMTEWISGARPLIVVDCEFKDNEKTMHSAMGNVANEMLETAGSSGAGSDSYRLLRLCNI